MSRLLHVIATDARRGAEVFSHELAEEFRAAGHEVRLMALESCGSPVHLPAEIAGRHRFDPVGLARLTRAARWADLVVSFGSSALITGGAAARLARRPFVYRNIGDPAVWGSVRFGDLRIGVPLRGAARIVALYPEAGDELVRRYGLDADRIDIIPRGVPTSAFAQATPEERRAARRHLGVADDQPLLGYLGALSGEKQPELAVEIAARLPDTRLVMAGDGPLREEITALAAARAPGRVDLLGQIDGAREFLAALDVLLLPSRTEGIPGVAIEAGLRGVPVVASRVGGVPYVVRDGSTGRIVDRSDDVDAYVEATTEALGRRDELGRAAAEHCREHFALSGVAERWLGTVERAIGSRRARGGAGPRRVLQVTATTERRGAELFAARLGESLSRRGWEVETVAYLPGRDGSGLDLPVLAGHRWDPRALLSLVRRARRSDVVIAHGSFLPWPGALAGIIAHRPVVYRNIGDPSHWGSVALADLRVGAPLRRVAAVVSLFPEARSWLIRHYRIRPDRVEIIANGAPAAAFAPLGPGARTQVRASLGLGVDTPLVAVVGALSPEKAVVTAVEAIGAMEGVHLVVVGDGPDRPQVEAVGERLAPGRLHLVGSLEDPAPTIGAADVLVLPSRTEGMPAVVVEAALMGVPAVAHAVGGVPCLIEDGVTGRLVDPSDPGALRTALREALEQRDEWGPAARQWALGRFEHDALADRWDTLLGRISGRPNASGSLSAGARPS